MRFLSASEDALLVELDDLAQTLAFHRALLDAPMAGIEELIPAARTVLVQYRPEILPRAALIAALRQRAGGATEGHAHASAGRLVDIPVRYDGADLAQVAELMGITVREVVQRHTAQPWQGAFAGFAPGFVYLAGGHASFAAIPRRATPRTRVPAGSVALAGDFSAVYPSASPGGWQLIGTTEIAMWDLVRAEPAYVQPGCRVRFIDAAAAHARVSLPAQARTPVRPEPAAEPLRPPYIEFVRAGVQTLVQDAGRTHQAARGISASGALDRTAMHQANRLVGNPIATPVLENLLGGLELRCHGAATLAVTGAHAALTLRAPDGRAWPLAPERAVALDDGDVLVIGTLAAGLRCYLAARGGWEVAPVLGSCATDTLARIGPAPIGNGARLAVGSAVSPGALGAAQMPDATPRVLPAPGDVVTLDLLLGPRTDWFAPQALDVLTGQTWQVTPESNRVGIRLQGATPLQRSRAGELPSEGTVAGALQVPASGQPVLFLADHPLTGGYPVIAVLARHHLDLAAQIPTGCGVRFRVLAPFLDQAAG